MISTIALCMIENMMTINCDASDDQNSRTRDLMIAFSFPQK